jgi:peptidylprolyl isomerase
LLCRDLVVGKGKAATRTSTVKVQYSLIYYRNGQAIQSTWQMGQPATFSIAPGHVIPGFTDGIGGTGKVAPMHVGGRRVMILPPSLAYGASGNQGIAPNATLVFVVDLLKVSG